MNAAFSNLTIPDSSPAMPTADFCLVHLKLLCAVHTLKEDIGYTDGLFGLWDAKCEVLEGKQREEALAKTREKRWALYIARAVERFEDWWIEILCPREHGKRLEGKEMVSTNKAFTLFTEYGSAKKWTPAMLPPLGKLRRDFDFSTQSANVSRCPYGLAFFYAKS